MSTNWLNRLTHSIDLVSTRILLKHNPIYVMFSSCPIDNTSYPYVVEVLMNCFGMESHCFQQSAAPYDSYEGQEQLAPWSQTGEEECGSLSGPLKLQCHQ